MPIDWTRIENFVGYGRHNAPVVFIGIEENHSGEQTLENDLLHRSKFDTIEDIQVASEGIAGAARWFQGPRPPLQPTWKPMCLLMLQRYGCVDPTDQDLDEYQITKLGRSGGATVLTELRPYPNHGNKWSAIYAREICANRRAY